MADSAMVRLRHNETQKLHREFDDRSRTVPRALALPSHWLGDDRKRPRQPNVGHPFRPRVCNPRRKAFLINAPQAVEILTPKLSQGKFHPVIVAAELHLFRPS